MNIFGVHFLGAPFATCFSCPPLGRWKVDGRSEFRRKLTSWGRWKVGSWTSHYLLMGFENIPGGWPWDFSHQQKYHFLFIYGNWKYLVTTGPLKLMETITSQRLELPGVSFDVSILLILVCRDLQPCWLICFSKGLKVVRLAIEVCFWRGGLWFASPLDMIVGWQTWHPCHHSDQTYSHPPCN